MFLKNFYNEIQTFVLGTFLGFVAILKMVQLACTIATSTRAAIQAMTMYNFVLVRNPASSSSSDSVLASVATETNKKLL